MAEPVQHRLLTAMAPVALGFRSSGHLPSGVSRKMLQMLILFTLVLPSLASYASFFGYGGKNEKNKKSKFLANFPSIIKFLMFWWCAFVFVVMFCFVLDQLWYKWRGPAKISWSKKFSFDGRASREAYWKQFADPSAWSMTHPIIQSADIRMVNVGDNADAVIADSVAAGIDQPLGLSPPKDPNASKDVQERQERDQMGLAPEPNSRLMPIDLKPFAPGLGLILRHKSGSGVREGLFFCSRECTLLEMPKDEPWHFQMKTIEAGAGHAFLPGSEVVDVVLHPTSEDGAVVCEMSGGGAVTSRFFRWWGSLEKLSLEGAEAMLQSINDELGRPKKDD